MELNSGSGMFEILYANAANIAAVAAARSTVISIHNSNIPSKYTLHFAHCHPAKSMQFLII